MANNREKKELNSKQASKISWTISKVYFNFMIVGGVIAKPTGDQAGTWLVSLIVGSLLIYVFFYYVIFDGIHREDEEKSKKIEDKTIQNLSYTDFREVYFLVTDEGSHIDMMKKILRKEECKFYAKFTDNENIYLVVKDKHDEEVYNAEIENYDYFNSHFKFHK